MSSREMSSINLNEPVPKRARVEQKTQDEKIAEKKERNRAQRLPPLGRNATPDNFIKWMFKNYTKELLADYQTQLLYWNSQTVQPNKRTFKLATGKKTPMYNSIQMGNSRATALSLEEQEIADAARAQKISITRRSRSLGQTNWLESAAFKAFVKFMQALGYNSVRFERMPDCVVVDFCAIITSEFGSVSAPVQVKVARGPPGVSVKFSVNKDDGDTGGRYEDHILICLVVDVSDDANLLCKDFDELPDVDILEAYIMKSSDIKSVFAPMVYDHKPGSKRGRKNAYEEFRYIVGRDGPNKLDKLMQSLESNVQEIWKKRKWTRDDCFFTFGKGSPNTNVYDTQQTELRGMKAVSVSLAPFESRSPLRHNETIDILFWRNSNPESGSLTSSSVRISLKTASYCLNTKPGDYCGFQFMIHKAPNSHHCDIVVAIQFDMASKTQVVSVYVFDSKDIYNNTGLQAFYWNKSAYTDKAFDMTNDAGRQAFKERVSSFMKTDDERTDEERRVQRILQRFSILYKLIQNL